VSQYFTDIWVAVTGDATLAEVLDTVKKPVHHPMLYGHMKCLLKQLPCKA
jgi:hypothetical protein